MSGEVPVALHFLSAVIFIVADGDGSALLVNDCFARSV